MVEYVKRPSFRFGSCSMCMFFRTAEDCSGQCGAPEKEDNICIPDTPEAIEEYAVAKAKALMGLEVE